MNMIICEKCLIDNAFETSYGFLCKNCYNNILKNNKSINNIDIEKDINNNDNDDDVFADYNYNIIKLNNYEKF